jgi:hypothetical protein
MLRLQAPQRDQRTEGPPRASPFPNQLISQRLVCHISSVIISSGNHARGQLLLVLPYVVNNARC